MTKTSTHYTGHNFSSEEEKAKNEFREKNEKLNKIREKRKHLLQKQEQRDLKISELQQGQHRDGETLEDLMTEEQQLEDECAAISKVLLKMYAIAKRKELSEERFRLEEMELQQRKAAEIAELDIQTQEQKILLKEREVTEAENASNNLAGDELLKKIYEFLTQTTSANNKTNASTAGSSERRNNKGDLRQMVEDCLQNAERPLSSGDIYERIKDKLPYGISDQTAVTAKISTILSSLKLYGLLRIFPGKGKRSTYLYKQEQ